MNNIQLAVQFFLQIAVILLFCRLVGAVALRFGQPQVVAEMIAGVFLGPSLFGLLAPEAQAWLFPWDNTQATRDTQSYLFPASQLGLALYMFVVGLEFRTDIVRKRIAHFFAIKCGQHARKRSCAYYHPRLRRRALAAGLCKGKIALRPDFFRRTNDHFTVSAFDH